MFHIIVRFSLAIAANVSSSKNPSKFLFKLNFEVNIIHLSNYNSLS
jgi:hypothetical protein